MMIDDIERGYDADGMPTARHGDIRGYVERSDYADAPELRDGTVTA